MSRSGDTLQRDVGLKINRLQFGVGFQIFPYGLLFPGNTDWEHKIPLSSTELFAHVRHCRRAWQDVIEYSETVPDPAGGERNSFPFQEKWNLRRRPDLLQEKGALLAKAGDLLFYQIFESRKDDRLTGPEAEMRQTFARRLREAASDPQRLLVITITSSVFFVPWGMLYTHPVPGEVLASDGKNFRWEGFWGYSHIIEHNPMRAPDVDHRIRPIQESMLLPIGINVDVGIDTSLNVRCIMPQIKFFKKQTGIEPIERRYKQLLEMAFRSGNLTDRILYFCCHGEASGEPEAPNLGDAWIKLTDGSPITGQDIDDWLRDHNLPSSPIIFLNACESGQLTTLFYQTLAAKLLEKEAVGLIGPQIKVPAVFACEYAQRFFKRFLSGSEKVRLGPLIRTLAREFVDKYKNPLGLIYSLYRGADCFVDR